MNGRRDRLQAPLNLSKLSRMVLQKMKHLKALVISYKKTGHFVGCFVTNNVIMPQFRPTEIAKKE